MNIKKTFVTLALSVLMLLPMAALAQGSLNAHDLGVDAVGNSIKLGSGDVRETAGRIINVSLSFLGIIAVAIVLYGGFKYMISGGNKEKTEEARSWIVAGIIGLAIILSAWAITQFVIGQLLAATTQ